MRTAIRGLGAAALAGLLAGLLPAQPAAQKEPPARVVAGKLVTETGSVLRREAGDGKPWQVVKQGEDLYTGDLLVGLPWAAIDNANGTFRLTFRADFAKKSPLPILESAVVLRKPAGLDFDFFLDRGRVDVTALTDKKASFTFGWQGKEPCHFLVETKGTSVVLETFSRWAPGVPFDPKGGKDHKPLADIILFVTKGEVLACTADADVRLSAPPGLAVFAMNSAGVGDTKPRFVEKLPEWLDADDKSPEAQKAKARLEEFRKLVVEKGPSGAIDAFLATGDPDKVRNAIIATVALDDVPRLRKIFYESKSPEVLDLCILVLRHWLGRDASHDVKFFDLLKADPKIPPAQAATVLQLLHSYGENDLAQVETYETLVSYLRHPALGIRALANFHLVRLYPDGKAFGFNPAGTDAERAAAVAKWKELITAGKLPPKRGS